MRNRLGLVAVVSMFAMFAMLLSACGAGSKTPTSGSAQPGALAPAPKAPEYPTKPVDILDAFAPGGSTDLMGRALADQLSKAWGQPINVVNKAGGSGTTGTVELIQAKPDGYTVLMHAPSIGVLNPAIQSTLPYKWDQFTFVARISTSPLVVVVKADSNWKTLKDMVEDVKKDPANFSYGTSGPGGPSTFATAQIMEQAGIDPAKLTKVVLGGGAPTLTAVAGGQVHFASQNLSEVIDLIKGGKLRGLAVSSDVRVKALPDVPTSKEAGFDKFTLLGWTGVVAPVGFPKEAVTRWNETIKQSLADPAFAAKMESLGLIPDYLGPDDFKADLKKVYDFALGVAERLKLRQ
jgi:tripartite-type tricarboxylate transporter receptor subunit TctC